MFTKLPHEALHVAHRYAVGEQVLYIIRTYGSTLVCLHAVPFVAVSAYRITHLAHRVYGIEV